MGNSNTYCKEVTDRANYFSTAYVASSFVVSAVMLLIPILLILPCQRIPVLGRIYNLLIGFVRWCDFDMFSYPTRMKYSTAGSSYATRMDTSILRSDDSSFVEHSNSSGTEPTYIQRDMKQTVKTIGGYFSLVLIVFAVYFISYIFYSYNDAISKPIEVQTFMMTKDDLKRKLKFSAEFIIDNCQVSQCSQILFSEFNGQDWTDTSVECVQKDKTCLITVDKEVVLSGAKMSGLSLADLQYKLNNWKVSESSSLAAKLYTSKLENSRYEDIFFYTDACRSTGIANVITYPHVTMKADVYLRKACSSVFGNVNSCDIGMHTIPRFDSSGIYNSTTNVVEISMTVVPLVLETRQSSRSSLVVLAIIISFITGVLTLQPLYKRFVSNTCVYVIRRRLTGVGIGVGHGLLVGLACSAYLIFTSFILFSFVTNVLLDYESRLPYYAFEFFGVFSIAGANLIIAVVIAGIDLVLCAVLLVFFMFYVGLSSKEVRQLQSQGETLPITSPTVSPL